MSTNRAQNLNRFGGTLLVTKPLEFAVIFGFQLQLKGAGVLLVRFDQCLKLRQSPRNLAPFRVFCEIVDFNQNKRFSDINCLPTWSLHESGMPGIVWESIPAPLPPPLAAVLMTKAGQA